MEQKKEIISYLQSTTLFLLGIFLIAFPLVISNTTTDTVLIPKQIFLGGTVLLCLVLFGIKVLVEKSVKVKRTYFDLPLFLVLLTAILSSLFAVNRFDSLIALFPLLLAIILYFIIVHTVQNEKSILLLISALILGGAIISASSVLSFFKIYLLPFATTHVQSFTPFGSLLEQAIYLGTVLAVSLYFGKKLIKDTTNIKLKDIAFGIASLIITLGLLITVYQLFTTQKPFILPFGTGFQTAFAAISQDNGRVLQGFLFGSGFGTYATDFTRFKLAVFNQNPTLWSLTFVRSTSFLLELLSTVGILGFSAFILLIIRVIKELREKSIGHYNSIFLALPLIFIFAILLPLNFITQTLIFIVLGFFAAAQTIRTGKDARFFEVELQIVAFKKGLITLEAPTAHPAKTFALPVIFSVIILLLTGTLGFFGVRFLLSDMSFQKSLVSASKNNGSQTYQEQIQAINLFPYRDIYYRVFSQTNLALANSLASQTKQGETVPADRQQTITTLIQQSINSGRQATTISPLTNVNWQNLSSLYRSLIGFGQNAENFSIATQQQSTALDPNNPGEYINLGGIYYQLQQWDNAQNQFQIAINLKPDLANSYYNLGHTLEQKGDLANALTQYQTVRTLVANDKNSLDQINKEITALEVRIHPQAVSKTETKQTTVSTQAPLNVVTPPAQLPSRKPQVAIPAPSATTSSK